MPDNVPLHISGPFGQAFRIPRDPVNYPAFVCGYVVDHYPSKTDGTPWDQYTIQLINLADFPGWDPAAKVYPDAQWELNIVALNPEKGRVDVYTFSDPKAADLGSLYLLPPNLVYQFHELDEGKAADLCHSATWGVCNVDGLGPQGPEAWVEGSVAAREGRLMHVEPLYSIWREGWMRMLDTTADHFRRGVHDGQT